jgi:hypothetical protein
MRAASAGRLALGLGLTAWGRAGLGAVLPAGFNAGCTAGARLLDEQLVAHSCRFLMCLPACLPGCRNILYGLEEEDGLAAAELPTQEDVEQAARCGAAGLLWSCWPVRSGMAPSRCCNRQSRVQQPC